MDEAVADRVSELELQLAATRLALELAMWVIRDSHGPRTLEAQEAVLRWLDQHAEPDSVRAQRVAMRALEQLGAGDSEIEELLPDE